MKSQQKLAIIIPAFNEEAMIQKVIMSIPRKIPHCQKPTIIVINDGSTDGTKNQVKSTDARVVTHILNRGLGGALGTAFMLTKKERYDVIVTLDADGQHNPTEISRLIQPIIDGVADVVIGSRLMSPTMPPLRKLINIFSNVVTFLLFGIMTSDSQSGFRAFSKAAIEKISIKTQGMEVSSEIFREIQKHNLTKVEIPIKAIYTNYSLSKGQRISNAPNVFWKLMLHQFRFL